MVSFAREGPSGEPCLIFMYQASIASRRSRAYIYSLRHGFITKTREIASIMVVVVSMFRSKVVNVRSGTMLGIKFPPAEKKY